MDFRQLEVYVAVVELCSFSRAAEKLYLSQPTISAHVSALEKELAVRLLIRNTREVYPSEAGRRLYEYAVKLLRLRDETIEEISSPGEQQRGIINIAASTIPAKHVLPTLISGFRKAHPGIVFNIIPCDSALVYRSLASGEAKVGFSGAAINSEFCRHYPIARDKLVLITQNNPRFAQMAEDGVSFDDLLQEPFILRPAGSGTRYEFEQYLSRRGFKGQLHIVAEMADTEAIKNSVAAGIGVSVISERSAMESARFGLVRIFSLPDGGERLLYLIRRKKDRLAERERAFCDYVLARAEKI